MTKVSISLTLDNDVVAMINTNVNRSALVNDILRKRLMTEKGIDKQIKETNEFLVSLKQQKLKIKEEKDNYLEDVSEELKIECKSEIVDKIHNIVNKGLKDKFIDNPNKVTLWTDIMNKRFHTTYTPDQMKKIAKRWG